MVQQQQQPTTDQEHLSHSSNSHDSSVTESFLDVSSAVENDMLLHVITLLVSKISYACLISNLINSEESRTTSVIVDITVPFSNSI